MIIDRNYILSRISFVLQECAAMYQKNNSFVIQNKKNLKQYRIKLLFPLWLRKIIFSSYNPVFAMYREKQRAKSVVNPYYLHPVALDFMLYALENNINFDTCDFFPPEDTAAVQEHIDSRIRSVISAFSNKKNISQDCLRFTQISEKNIRKEKGFYTLSYEDICYRQCKKFFSYSVFGIHYGLKNLPESVKNYISGKDFLDVGSLDGDAGIMFLQYLPRRIFAYEPASTNYQLLQDNIKLQQNDKIQAVKKGIGDKEAEMEMSIDDINAGANTLLDSISISKNFNREKVQITTIDAECADKNVGLIKMDIEGFEYYAIKGAAETIKRDKPVLLISIYHTGKDFFEIPPLLKSYVPEYKFRYIDIDPNCSIADKIIAAYI